MDTAWHQIQMVWTSDVSGLEALRFNLYLGRDTGTYYFDDFALTAEAGTTALRRPIQGNGKPLLKRSPVSGVDAAGHSGRIGERRLRFR